MESDVFKRMLERQIAGSTIPEVAPLIAIACELHAIREMLAKNLHNSKPEIVFLHPQKKKKIGLADMPQKRGKK